MDKEEIKKRLIELIDNSKHPNEILHKVYKSKMKHIIHDAIIIFVEFSRQQFKENDKITNKVLLQFVDDYVEGAFHPMDQNDIAKKDSKE